MALDSATPQTYEIRDRQQQEQPDQATQSQRPKEAVNAPTNEDYEPNPSASIELSPDRQRILDSILRLYSGSGTHEAGSTGEQDMHVYARRAVYDDVWSYCDTRYKIAGQWYGIPLVMKSSVTKAVEVVASTTFSNHESTDAATDKQIDGFPATIVFKMKREWTPRVLGQTFTVNHFVTLSLEDAVGEDGHDGPRERVKYHKDQWNEKDYSHRGLGKVLKTLNGDVATLGTRPPGDM